jgi:hypothetical protein
MWTIYRPILGHFHLNPLKTRMRVLWRSKRWLAHHGLEFPVPCASCFANVSVGASRTSISRCFADFEGVLRMHRDPALPEIFAEVSAQVPAEHTQGTVAKLTFTAETWSAAHAAIHLRNQQEVYLGYWHSHPVREWCKSRECSPEKQKTCHLAKDFFSEDDSAVDSLLSI